MTLRDRHREPRRRAIALVDDELERLRRGGNGQLAELAGGSPLERESEGLTLTTHVSAEGARLLVLVEVSRGRRMLATGGFAMLPDGSTQTPH